MANISRLTAAVCAVCIAALVLSACGSGSQSVSTAPGPTPSTVALDRVERAQRVHFVARAEMICSRGEAALVAGNAHFNSNHSTLAQYKAQYLHHVAPVLLAELRRCGRSAAPVADWATIAKLLSDLALGIRQSIHAIRSAQTVKQASKVPVPPGIAAANLDAREYGLPRCAAS